VPNAEFLGVGDATDFELGQTSVLYAGNCRLLIDCGPQIPSALTRRLGSADELDGIYLTHGHADHCFGLASLLLWLRENGRVRSLALLAEADVLRATFRLIELGYPGAFAASKCFAIEAAALSVSNRYAFRGTTIVIAPTEHGLPNYAIRIEDNRAVFAMSGDGVPTIQTAEIYGGVDLLVHECAYLDRSNAHHTNVTRLVELCRAVHPRRLAVTHCARAERAAIESRLSSELGGQVAFPQPSEVLHFAAE
jgi:ribonuclease Z